MGLRSRSQIDKGNLERSFILYSRTFTCWGGQLGELKPREHPTTLTLYICESGLVYLQGWQLCEEGADVGSDLVVRGHLPTQLLRTQPVLRTTDHTGDTAHSTGDGELRAGEMGFASQSASLHQLKVPLPGFPTSCVNTICLPETLLQHTPRQCTRTW